MTAPCPQCHAPGFANPSELAAHLIDAHGMAGMAALALVRQTAGEVRAGVPPKPTPPTPIPVKETPMSANSKKYSRCHACGAMGHTRRSSECPKRGTAAVPAAATKRKAITRRHPMKPTPATASGNGLVTEIEALGAVAAALVSLDLTAQSNMLGCVCKLLGLDPAKLAA